MGSLLLRLIDSFENRKGRMRFLVLLYALSISLMVLSKEGFNILVRSLKLLPVFGVLVNMGFFELTFYIITVSSILLGMIATEKINEAGNFNTEISKNKDKVSENHSNDKDFSPMINEISNILKLTEDYLEYFAYGVVLAIVSFSLFTKVYSFDISSRQTIAIFLLIIAFIIMGVNSRKKVLLIAEEIKRNNKSMQNLEISKETRDK